MSGRHRDRVSAALLLAVLSAGVVAQDAGHAKPTPLVGQRTIQFVGPADSPLLMPTGVSVAADGTVAVADGVNDRLALFGADGTLREFVTQIGDEPLSNPLNVRFDDRGQLWIADNGHARVLVRAADGTLARIVTVPASATNRAAAPPGRADAGPDIVDALPSLDGRVAWVVDNNHHQLIRCDLESGQTRVVGQRGESLGEFQYPYTLARAAGGDVLVVDVINGRVQRLDNEGTPTGSIGNYGVDLGQLFRPKGIAVDADGNTWVSDGLLGVIQVFTPDGRLIDVLRGDDGKPLRFQSPMGLAFDPAGDLYVVELGANSVQRVALTRNAAAPLAAAAAVRRLATMGPQARMCTVCHLEWIQPLVDGVPTELAVVPPNPAQYPWVSRSTMCLTCHDGSVGDARRRVWIEHGHRTGIAPPAGMTVPATLPLANGEIACRTCHSAHALSEARTTIEEIVFLRVAESPAELCVQCHADRTTGVSHGMHPLTEMPGGVPAELVHIQSEATRSTVTCLACHTGHGAQRDDLLVMSPDDNRLCLTCHAELKPQLFSGATRAKHGRMPALSAGQLATAAQWGTRISPQEQLLCTTCHRSHNAPQPQYLLAFDPLSRDACGACHVAEQTVTGSPHDLSVTRPDAVNAAGLTATVGGACSGCHTAHQPARLPRPTPADPRGLCTNCHDAGELAEEKTLGPVNHPEVTCVACHNPHSDQFGSFLLASATDLCRGCHADKTPLLHGPHDIARDRDAWPAAAANAGDACLACHRPHGNEENGLFRLAPAVTAIAADGACLACHPDAADAGGNALALDHPRSAARLVDPGGLPLAQLPDGEPGIACSTCHDPHGSDQQADRLLRVEAGQSGEDLCLRCHTERANIHMIGHSEPSLRAAGFTVGSCQPCHVTHADPASLTDTLMWPKALAAYPQAEIPRVTDEHCIACHRVGGPVAPPAVATHPVVNMFNPYEPDSPNFLPLFNDAGEVDPAGHIGCRTCHLTHGRSDAADIPRGITNETTREMRARAWHIRTFPAESVCTTCHGFDAWRRFLYFHTPALRGGSISAPLPPVP